MRLEGEYNLNMPTKVIPHRDAKNRAPEVRSVMFCAPEVRNVM